MNDNYYFRKGRGKKAAWRCLYINRKKDNLHVYVGKDKGIVTIAGGNDSSGFDNVGIEIPLKEFLEGLYITKEDLE